ncbi:MAG: 2-dehydro-3-deoxygalactonokinase [Pseudomonadota bacterium]
MNTRLIGLDWGTSSLRAYLMSDAGQILDRREVPAGILTVENQAFEPVFLAQVQDWRGGQANCAIVASGMITSRQGWIETPYQPCPAGREELAAATHEHQLDDGTSIHFITGVAVNHDAAGIPDVMRGEETQIVGAFDADQTAVAVMPGSHSKWVQITQGKVANFTTFMTGEVYAALIRQTILGRVVTKERDDPDAFRQGLSLGLDEGAARGGILGRLFSARTLVLFDRLDGDAVPSYVSGLVLGTEIREAQRAFDWGREPVHVIGGDALARRYQEALGKAGIAIVRTEPDRAAFGHFAIARAKGLI